MIGSQVYNSLLLLRGQNPFNGEIGGIRPNAWERITKAVPEAGPRVCDIASAYLQKDPAYEEKGRQRLASILASGSTDWYNWNCDHWGTKWSSYEVQKTENGFSFQTAWSFPQPIFEALVEQYPTLTFDCLCFDEGWNFGGVGQFGADVVTPFDTRPDLATDDLFESVYGYAPEHEDDE